MPQFYVGTDANKLGDVHTNDKTGQLIRETFYPAAPNTDKIPAGSPGGIATEWVVAHPTYAPGAVIAFTSYWNKHPANMACFKTAGTSEAEDGEEEESSSKNNGSGGALEKAFEMSTGGRQVVHAMFYPKLDGEKLALACAHYNDAMVTFFQFPVKGIPDAPLENQPALTIELPELVPGTRRTLGVGKWAGHSVPSCHHVYYAPNGKYLLCVDPNQSAIITYEVDDTGLPTKPEPTSTFSCQTDAPALSWLASAVGGILRFGCRPRRVAVSPNGRFVFVSYEFRNVIQVYAIDEETGKIDPESNGCMQEISTLDESLTSRKVVGFSFQACAEMIVYDDALYISNRGGGAGASENSIKVFDIKDGGRLVARHTIPCSGPVRHFCVMGVPVENVDSATDDGNIVDGDAKDVLLVAGTTRSLQTFRRHHGDSANKFELVGEADVGTSVYCVAPAEGSA